jgi:hypothetical protein
MAKDVPDQRELLDVALELEAAQAKLSLIAFFIQPYCLLTLNTYKACPSTPIVVLLVGRWFARRPE